jgi:hypothetical protein
MRDRKLADLNSEFAIKVYKLLSFLVEAGIMIMIVETLRTEAQHQIDLASGHSWITHSKHQDGLAIDIAPYDVYQEHGDDKLQWDSSDPIWTRIGLIGESLGLVWGGRWVHKDMGHFELRG